MSPFTPSTSLMPDVRAVRVSPTRAVPLMVGAPVAPEFCSGTVTSRLPDSFLPSWVQMAPSAAQSEVAWKHDGRRAVAARFDGDLPPNVLARHNPARLYHVATRNGEGVVPQGFVAEVVLGRFAEAQLEGEGLAAIVGYGHVVGGRGQQGDSVVGHAPPAERGYGVAGEVAEPRCRLVRRGRVADRHRVARDDRRG